MGIIYCTTISGTTFGIEGKLIQVEVDVSDGLPGINMVGMLSSEVKESGERVRTALKNTGFFIPPKRITVNLSPADIKKQGSSFDLPIAAAILANLGSFSMEQIRDRLIIGELSLNGTVKPVRGILPVVLEAKRAGIKSCILPIENIREGAMVEGIEILGVRDIRQLCGYFVGEKRLMERGDIPASQSSRAEGNLDFAEVNGQDLLRRVVEIAAAGLHNFLMTGAPGSGKTMIARRIPTILPYLNKEESLELTRIYSVAGLLTENEWMEKRPFRAPHHTATAAALIGGGSVPRPGEVTLATHGVLFVCETLCTAN